MINIYVASSWRNDFHPRVVEALKAVPCFKVYDYRHPDKDDNGFAWEEIDPNWRDWTAGDLAIGLGHHRARDSFEKDKKALVAAHIVIAVAPIGISTALELGFAAGRAVSDGRCSEPLVLLREGQRAELMLKLGTIVLSMADLMLELFRGVRRLSSNDYDKDDLLRIAQLAELFELHGDDWQVPR